MSDIVKQSTLNLFLDNIVDNISAADMRLFVENIWDDKENSIRKIGNLQQITSEIGIEANDIIVCTEGNDEGMYIADIKDPEVANLTKITSQTSEIPGGVDGQILSLNNGELIWIDRDYTFQVIGTLPIEDIMIERPNAGITYIAENNSTTALVPGVIGDGYTWNGLEWLNIGQMRGTQGVIGQTGTAGNDGDGFRAKGSETVTNILFKNSGTPAFSLIGDVWIATDSGNDSQGTVVNVGDALACSNPDIPTWYNIGIFEGPAGIDGTNGTNGIDGIDGTNGTNGTNGTDGIDGEGAYDLAVSQGFVGTEVQWIASLQGTDGIDGQDGADSTVAGPEGLTAYEIAVQNGFVGDENTWLNSLVGADGIDGAAGTDGIDGDDASVIFATQGEVDTGTATDAVISPSTFDNSAQLASKEPIITPGLADQVYVTNNTGNGKGWVDADAVAPVRSVNGKTGIFSITATDVGLGNADNTSDAAKPISSLTQAALNLKSDTDHEHTVLNDTLYEPKDVNIQAHISDSANPHSVTKDQVGLGNIPNDVPADWPVSTATQTELDKSVHAGGDATFNDMDLFLLANTLFQVDGSYLNAPTDPLKGVCIVFEATESRHATQQYWDADGATWSRAYNDDTPGWSTWTKNAELADITKIQDGTYKTTGFTPSVDIDFATKKYVDDTTLSGGLTNTQVAAMYHAEALVDPSFYKFADADKAKLTGIENNATADQTEAEIVALYQSGNVDYFNSSDRTKLDGIEAGAAGDMTGAEIAGVYETYSDVERFTTAYKIVVGNTTGINTGDQTADQIEGILYDGSRDNNKFTDSEQTKLGLLSPENLFKGTYLNDSLLADEWGPTGTSGVPAEGSYAYINNNVDDVFTVRVWDMDDALWKEVAPESSAVMTVEEIEALLYDDAARNNNKYSDQEKVKLGNLYDASTVDVNAFNGSGYVTAERLEGPFIDLRTDMDDADVILQSNIDNKEDALGNPGTNGDVLISDTLGNRSWTTINTAAQQTDYTTFVAITEANSVNSSFFLDTADSKIKYRVTPGNIVNVIDERSDYKFIQGDLSVGSLAGGADAAARPTYNAAELAFLSDITPADLTAIETKITDISWLADVTSVDNKLQYLNMPADYAVEYAAMASNEVLAKGHLQEFSQLLNAVAADLGNATDNVYAEALTVPPTLAEIETALDIHLGGNGTNDTWAGTQREFTLYSVPTQIGTEAAEDRVPTAAYTVKQRLIGDNSDASAGTIDKFYIDAITAAV